MELQSLIKIHIDPQQLFLLGPLSFQPHKMLYSQSPPPSIVYHFYRAFSYFVRYNREIIKRRRESLMLNPEKIIYILVPVFLLVLVFGEGLNNIVYSILSFLLGLSMLYLAYSLLRKQREERKQRK